MAERVTKAQMDHAIMDYEINVLNGILRDAGSKIQVYYFSHCDYYFVANQLTNHIYFRGTLGQCKDFVSGVQGVLLGI